MNIDYISDIHLDFWCREYNNQSPKMKREIDSFLQNNGFLGGDALIIAGDLGHYNQQDKFFLSECKKIYKDVFLVSGNHDMYLVSENIKKRFQYDSSNRVQDIKDFCKEKEIHYLDGTSVEINGIVFAGCAMSWDKSFLEKLHNKQYSEPSIRDLFDNTMNDSVYIYGGHDNYYVSSAYGAKYWKQSWDPFKYFEEEFNKLQEIKKADIIISHYCPVNPFEYQESTKGYHEDETSTFYMFDGYSIVDKLKPKYWIFGHMHNNYDFKHNETNFLCNPLGYPGENLNNKPKKLIIN